MKANGTYEMMDETICCRLTGQSPMPRKSADVNEGSETRLETPH